MSRRDALAVDEAARAAPERPSRSATRREADRARAVPWSLAGETGSAIAARPGVRAEQVRRWRPAVRSGGVAALRARPRPGRTPREREAALAAAREGLAGPATERRVRTPARLAAEVARRDDLAGPPGRGAARGGYRWRRPRHAPKGRQAADAVDRAGPRLKLPKRQAAAGVDLHLPFGDEPEAPTHPYLAHRRAARGADLRVEAPGRAKRRALPGVLDHARRELIVVTGGTERSGDFVDLPGRLDRGYGPAPSREGRPVLLVLDDGPIHTGRAARKALAARPRLTVERLPRHAPELNDVERSWGDPKRHSLAHRTFRDADGLDAAIHHAVGALNRERQARACASISRAA